MNTKPLYIIGGIIAVIIFYKGLDIMLAQYFDIPWYYMVAVGAIMLFIFRKKLG